VLTHIHIRDFAIVDELELELGPAMWALTGETGAGKSILVDALGLALGDRGDSSLVRGGAERAEISVGFDLGDAEDARRWLEEQDLGTDDECYLRRVLGSDGRSRGYINNRPVPMQSLRELGEMLVDIHGQHEHQSLLRRDTQRRLLDDFAGNAERLARLQDIHQEWKTQSERLENLRAAATDRAERLDLLRFQVDELEQLNLNTEELAGIGEEHSRLAHAGQLLETCERAVAGLYEAEDGAVHDQLSHIHAELEPLCDIDPQLATARELLGNALVQVGEAVDELRHYTDRLDLDPQRLQWLEQRLASIHDLARKHRVDDMELPGLAERLRTELDELDHADEHLATLEESIGQLRARYDQAADELSEKRRGAAETLNQRVDAIVQQLGMAGAGFRIAVTATGGRPSPSGVDTVEFLVSTNPGQAFQPLAKIASGGELSRFSLAIQVVLAHNTRIPTLIYDEVDTGIGGAVAEVVGRQLRALGEVRQVLCVTHLPQVAAQAHQQLRVSKALAKGTVRTHIEALDQGARVEEIARMLGGVEISAQTRAHAGEMIDKAQKAPKKPATAKKGRAKAKRA